jgi:hypothetical protein
MISEDIVYDAVSKFSKRQKSEYVDFNNQRILKFWLFS